MPPETPQNNIPVDTSTIPSLPPRDAQIAPITPREMLYNTAKSCLGTDASPSDIAPDEFGCAETVDNIHKMAFGAYINGSKDVPTLSTREMYKLLLGNIDFFRMVIIPDYGDIVISPTGYGNGNLPNGHVGIVGKFGILSNDSATGKFKENYTLETWVSRYKNVGGYPVVFFRRV